MSGKTILGVLAGLATGAALGILFAPEKGSTTRKKILRRGEGYLDDIKEKFDDLVDSVSEQFECTKKEAEDMIRSGKSKFDSAVK